MNLIQPVIIAGGSGTRLWPLSRRELPKQFLKIHNEQYTLLQLTVLRVRNLNSQKPVIICNTEHRFLVAEQMREINVEVIILLEPESKNTAPALGLVAHYLSFVQKNNLYMLVLAADHIIEHQLNFERAIAQALTLSKQNKLVTFGVVPTHAEIGYGYIKRGQEFTPGFLIDSFVEKPSLEVAQQYLVSKQYFWNSGMFVMGLNSFLGELKLFAPDIFSKTQQAIERAVYESTFIYIDRESLSTCRSESIDYAVMEKTSIGAVVELDAGWSDIGSWSAVWDVSHHKDDHGNVLQGDILSKDSINNYCYSKNRLVSLLGVEDLIIVDTKDALLIADKSKVQNIKEIVDELNQNNRTEHLSHCSVIRPWGNYECIDESERYKVKRITVEPGQKLSLQMHYHRAEHWVVVSGTAKIYKGDESFILCENQSTYIPIGEIHSLENPGRVKLELIEIQTGGYLAEDDIVRLKDAYGREVIK